MRILSQILDYKFEPGMIAWVMHRLTGIALFFYLIPHLLLTGEMIAAANNPNRAEGVKQFADIYAQVSGPLITVLEILLAGVVLFHAINGLRILLVDFTGLVRKDDFLNWAAFALWLVSFGAFAAMMAATHWM